MQVLPWFARRGLIEPDDLREMLAWGNRGFALDVAVCVAAYDRARPEGLLRYCARPSFALKRLQVLETRRVIYRLVNPRRDGVTALILTPAGAHRSLCRPDDFAAQAAAPLLPGRARAQLARACSCHRV